MGIYRTRDLAVAMEKGKLVIVDLLTLTVFHRREWGVGAVMACSDEYVFVGDVSGALVALGLFDLREREVCRMKTPVTAVFYLDGFVYCGSEEGSIHIYGVVEKCSGESGNEEMLSSLGTDITNEMFASGGDEAKFRLVRSMKHPGPVMQICGDGTELFVADMRNKITIYPSRKTYDIKGPRLRYKNYMFASERNMLYCKTRSAFATYITLDDPISDYVFSTNGGVLFVRCGGAVHAIEFNTRKALRKIEVEGEFVYDDDRNRIVWVSGGKVGSVEDVLEGEHKEMDDILFREDGLVEKKVRMGEEMDPEVASRYADCESRSAVRKRKYFKANEEWLGEPEEWQKRDERRGTVIESDEEPEGENAEDKPALSVQALHTKEGGLLCYNSEGYMVHIQGEGPSRIEVNYHDVARRKIEMPGIDGCIIGSFCKNSVIVGDGRKIFYTGPSHRWEREVKARIVCAGENMVVVLSDELQVFGLDGSEVFSCLIPDVHAICCCGDTIAVFSRELIVIELFKSTERFLLPSPVDFACFDENKRIFYRINGKMYYLYKGLSVRACEVGRRPLAVWKGHVVSLGASSRLFPSPHVEYTRFDLVAPPGSKEAESMDEERAGPAKENRREGAPEEARSKRYNPLNK